MYQTFQHVRKANHRYYIHPIFYYNSVTMIDDPLIIIFLSISNLDIRSILCV